jgi:drug/metabolite transporter (DMT)-like permease
LAAGFGSAVLNVCVKKTAGMAENVRAFLQIFGAVLLGLVWLPFEAGSALPRADSAGAALLVVLFMGAALLMTNRLYQFGVSNLTMHQAVVIFPFELVVGALSSWLLKGEVLNMQTWVGGGLILGASMVSSWWGVTDDAERV